MIAPPFDCVVTYHQNPLTCGVAKFNHIMAARLGLPLLGIFDPALAGYKAPLLSIKCSEFADQDLSRLHGLVQRMEPDVSPYLFLHGFENTLTEFELVSRAAKIYCGNREIYERLKDYAEAAGALWSPSTLRTSAVAADVGEISIFSFGMAHKLQAQHYFSLRDLLDASGKDYTIFLSAALHDGTSFEDAFSISFDQLRTVFDDNIRFLGFLSDDAVVEYMRRAMFFTAFFQRGVRENNSSVIAAMEQGCVVITNLDENSPNFCTHGRTLLDIQQLSELPLDKSYLSTLSDNARTAVADLGWDSLLARMGEVGGAFDV